MCCRGFTASNTVLKDKPLLPLPEEELEVRGVGGVPAGTALVTGVMAIVTEYTGNFHTSWFYCQHIENTII